MVPAIELECVEGPPLTRRRWRVANPFRIGRATGNELELVDPSISRRHAAVEVVEGGWVLRDCGSQLGTLVNELAVESGAASVIRAGDVIGVGPWRFRVQASDEASGFPDDTFATRISVVRGPGNLAEQRLELLLRYAGEVTAATDETMLAEILAEHALLGSGFSRARVLWQEADATIVRCERPAPRDDHASRPPNATLLASAGTGDVASLEAEPVEERSATARSAQPQALCAPLMLDGRAVAFLYVDADRPAARRQADAPSFCHALARLAALALAGLRRRASERERIALAADLERARDVQHRLLPIPAGRIARLDYALRLHPGRVVAGDIVDVVELAGGCVAVVLGDVSGAGLGAGLVMASVQSFLRAALAHDADPARVVAQLNVHLCAQASGGRFVTLWLGVFDASGATCRFVDAGHGHAVRFGSRSVAVIATRGAIPLGIDTGAVFEDETLALEHGEILLLHSDGLVEQRAPDGQEWGRGALVAAGIGKASPQELVEAVWSALERHAAGAVIDDDASVLALARA